VQMFVFGEVQDPLPETVRLVEDVVRGQIIEIVRGAVSLSSHRIILVLGSGSPHFTAIRPSPPLLTTLVAPSSPLYLLVIRSIALTSLTLAGHPRPPPHPPPILALPLRRRPHLPHPG
jgi:hypothetical protein